MAYYPKPHESMFEPEPPVTVFVYHLLHNAGYRETENPMIWTPTVALWLEYVREYCRYAYGRYADHFYDETHGWPRALTRAQFGPFLVNEVWEEAVPCTRMIRGVRYRGFEGIVGPRAYASPGWNRGPEARADTMPPPADWRPATVDQILDTSGIPRIDMVKGRLIEPDG